MAGLRIGIDTGDSAAKIEAMRKALLGLQSTGDGAASSASQQAGALRQLMAVLNPTGEALKKVANSQKMLSKAFFDGKINRQQYDQANAALQSYLNTLNGTNEAALKASEAQKAQQQSVKQLLSDLMPVETALKSVAERRKELGQAFARGDVSRTQFDQMSAALDRLRDKLNGTHDAQNRQRQAAQGQANALASIRDRLDPVGVQLQRVSREIALVNDQFSRRNIGEVEHRRLIAQLREEEAELERVRRGVAGGAGGSGAHGSGGITDHQRAFADRYLPNQVHDAARSLASGMSPMTVLFQQGSQIKDMYGSVGEALKGVGGYLTKLVNPAVVASAAIAGIAYSVYSVSSAFAHTRDQIILSGRSMKEFIALQGTASSVRMQDTGVNSNLANNAVAAAATNAKVAYADIGKVAAVAAQAQASLGKSVSDTVSEYASLRDGGTSALVSLNDKYGFLSVAQYQQIKNLQDMGKETEAAAISQDLYLQKMKDVAKQSEEALPAIKRMWRNIKNELEEYSNGLAVLLGQGSKLDELNKNYEMAHARVVNMRNDKDSWLSTYTTRGYNEALKELSVAEAARDAYKISAAQQEKSSNDSKIEVNKRNAVEGLVNSNLTGSEREEKERKALLNKLKENGASDEEIAKALKGFNENHKKRTASTSASGESMLKGVRENGAALDLQLKALQENSGQLSEAEKAIARFDQKIAGIHAKGAKTSSDKDMLANQDAIRAQLEDNSLTEEGIRLEKEKAEAIKKQAEVHKKSLEDVKALNDATATAYEVRGMGSRDAGRYKQRKAINDDPELTGEDKEAKLQALENSYRQADAAQQDWASAASSAWSDFKAQSMDVAGTVSSGMKSAFDQASSALTTFVTTGKLSFNDLLNTAAQTAAKIGMQYAAMSLFGGATGATGTDAYATMFSTGGYVGKPRGYATGGHIKGPGTGTSDDIPAMLSNGEFVVNEAATKRHRGLLEAINSSGGSTMARFATGGAVDGSGIGGNASGGGININMNMTVNASGQQEGQQAGQAIGDQVSQIIDAKIAQSEGRTKQFVVNQTVKSGGIINSQIKSGR